jgi:release factor glutamine methyltransferase
VTIHQALALARQRLADGKSENPSLESEVLLKHYLQKDRVFLYREPQTVLDEKTETAFSQGIERLLRGEPLAYIIHSREFFGLDFYVDQRVLIPRPETELLVEEAISLIQTRLPNIIADIGTGSGIIAVSLAKSLLHPSSALLSKPGSPLINNKTLPPLKIYAADISAPALEVARTNSGKLGVSEDIIFLQGDLLEPLPEAVDLIIANLPYVRRADMNNMPSARYEPQGALDGGDNGLESISRFCCMLPGKLGPCGSVLMEIGLGQANEVTALLKGLYPDAKIEVIPDLARIERVVKIAT